MYAKQYRRENISRPLLWSVDIQIEMFTRNYSHLCIEIVQGV